MNNEFSMFFVIKELKNIQITQNHYCNYVYKKSTNKEKKQFVLVVVLKISKETDCFGKKRNFA